MKQAPKQVLLTSASVACAHSFISSCALAEETSVIITNQTLAAKAVETSHGRGRLESLFTEVDSDREPWYVYVGGCSFLIHKPAEAVRVQSLRQACCDR